MSENLYDFPEFYDLIFRDDTKVEADFLEAVWREHGRGRLGHLLEPACGSGRLVRELVKRGYSVTGFDLNEKALAFAQQQLTVRRRAATLCVADMVDFTIKRQFDLAYCTINTFRYLTREEQARQHLQCVADHLKPGGLYVLGFHLLPPGSDESCVERSRVETPDASVDFELKVLDFCRRKRIENTRLTMTAVKQGKKVRVRCEHPMRIYRADQFESLLRKVPDLDLVETYDFDYDIEFPRDLDDDLNDAVFVLRKE